MRSQSILKTLALLFIVCVTLLGACSGGSSSGNTEADGPKKAALEGLVSVREMAADSDFEFFGYKSQSDVGTEQLGAPLSIRDIDIDALLSSSVLTESLIIDTQEYLFPVFVREESVSSLRVGRKDDGNWTLIAIEADTYDIDLAVAAIKSHSFDRTSCYLLDLPEIELLMLGCQRNGELRLVPLYAPSPAFVIDTEYSFADIIGAIKAAVLAAKDSQVEPASDVPLTSPLFSAVQPSQAVVKAAQTNTTNKTLPIALVAQEQSQWCWAATAEMTMRFKAIAGTQIPSQCSQATKAQDAASFLKQFDRQDCCANDHANASKKPCNTPWFPEYDKWGFTWSRTDVAPSWEQLKLLINKDQPLAFLWRWKPVSKGNAHYMVAIGYKETSNNRFVEYLDPSPVGKGSKTTKPYDVWVGGASKMYDHVFGIYFTDIVDPKK
jgi:hypothetical protein